MYVSLMTFKYDIIRDSSDVAFIRMKLFTITWMEIRINLIIMYLILDFP